MPVGSNAPFFIELSLISGGSSIDLRATDFFQSLEIEEVSTGAWTGQLVLFDHEGDYLENLIIAAGVDRNISIKFGRGDDEPGETHEYVASIPVYQPQFEPHGITLTLDLLANPALAAVVDKKPRSFEPDLRISTMVQRIANDREWDAVIEETQGTMSEPFSSTGESDMQFIREQLIPHAVSARTGEGGYICHFDRDNVFHFHTPDFLDPEVHDFLYGRHIAGDVVSFAPEDASLFGKLMGGGNAKYGGVGSLLGQSTQINSDLSSGVAGSGGSPVQSDGDAKQSFGTGTHSYWDLASRDAEELERMTKARFDAFRRYEYRALLTVHGTHRVRMSDYVNVDYVKRDGRLHYLSGRFQVFKRRHTVDSSGWQTEFEVLRFGLSALEGTETVVATQTNTPQTAASSTGIDLQVET